MEKTPDDILKGKTLRVYWFVLRAGKPVRVTDIQHGLQFSSASLVQYHLTKLVEAGLVAEEQGGFVVRRVEVKHFFMLRGTLIPFQVAYVLFFSITLAAMLGLIVMRGQAPVTSLDFLAIMVNVVALSVCIYETARTLRSLP